MDLPEPTRILWADVCRDGGSFELGFLTADGREFKLKLPVKRGKAGWFRPAALRVGYLPPVLSGPSSADQILDWQQADRLSTLLRPLVQAGIEAGGAQRAEEMLQFLSMGGAL